MNEHKKDRAKTVMYIYIYILVVGIDLFFLSRLILELI